MSDTTVVVNDESSHERLTVGHLIQGSLGINDSLAEVRPFRHNTIQETLMIRVSMMRVSNLYPYQFVESAWGFPVIPLPDDREKKDGSPGLLRAPQNLSIRYVGHPIFWIDPKLTDMSSHEAANRHDWSVRMYYLIMALGLWSPGGSSWLNAPHVKGIRYNNTDFHNFIHGHTSVLDEVMFTESDLLVPMEEVEKSTQMTIEKLARIEAESRADYHDQQTEAYEKANRLLSPDNLRWSKLEDTIQELSVRLGEAIHNDDPVSVYVEPIYETKRRVVAILSMMETLNVILSTPSTRDFNVSPDVYAGLVSVYKTYNDNIAQGGYDNDLSAVLDQMFDNNGTVHPKEFARYHEKASALHMDAWRRLKLSTVNFTRWQNGLGPYMSYVDMELDEAATDEDTDGIASLEELQSGLSLYELEEE